MDSLARTKLSSDFLSGLLEGEDIHCMGNDTNERRTMSLVKDIAIHLLEWDTPL
jgi:hypothetical protein